MKKLLLLFALVISIAASGVAQNANRSGIFVEAGAGLFVGTLPINKIEWKDNSLIAYKAGGPDLNFAVGYRGANRSIFAWEIKFEASGALKSSSTLVFALMPGIRFTTKEIFGNSSLYFGMNLGLAVGSIQQTYNYHAGFPDTYIEPYSKYTAATRFSLCTGLNVTTAFYAGLYWDYTVFPSQIYNLDSFLNDGSENTWGSLGIRLGYRF